jgi:hypothetical protein
METPELCNRLGLHQELVVIYTVDGYMADLLNEDACLSGIEAVGDTVIEAIMALESKLVSLK